MLDQILTEMQKECNQLVEYLCEAESPSIETMEVSFRQMMQRIGGRFIELCVQNSSLRYMGKRIPCSCGHLAEFKGYRKRQIQTAVGLAKIERAYYHCSSCGKGFAPADEHLGISRRCISRTVERAICRLSAVESFEAAVEDLYDVGGISVSAKEAQLVSESVGAEIAKKESAYVDAVFSEEEQVVPEDNPHVLCVEMDGKIVQTREGGRELKVAAISNLVAGDNPQRLDVGRTTYIGRFEVASDFGRYVWVEASRRGAPQAKELIGLGDGAPWIWNQISEHFPEAVQILDFYHASEHIWELGKVLYGEVSKKTKRWVQYKLDQISTGDVKKTITALKKLKPKDKDKVEKLRREIGYLEENKGRMNYPSYRKMGYHIGSGIVESACKQFGARLDAAGMRWIEPGANSIAALRALKLSGRWDDHWKPVRPPLYA